MFEYVTGGVVSGMVPSEGPVGGGTRVQVVGSTSRQGGNGMPVWAGGAYAVGRWESSSLVHCTSPMRGTEGVVRVLAVTDGVEMCGEEDGGRYVYREWPRVVRVDPEEGVQARRRWCGWGWQEEGHCWRWQGVQSAGWEARSGSRDG